MAANGETKVALITGAAKRIGRCIAETLHADGYNVVLHYHRSADAAKELARQLNQQRAESAITVGADLLDAEALSSLATTAISAWGRLDLLVNNASSYFPTPLASSNQSDWENLMGSNLKAPYFLSQACAVALSDNMGCIINLIDSNVLRRPIAEHPIYSSAKAGLHGLTLALARDLAPKVRVNGIAPGAVLWADTEADLDAQTAIINATALKQVGQPLDIANGVLFLSKASYISGFVLKIDGGKNL